jgi:hypothetical protein
MTTTTTTSPVYLAAVAERERTGRDPWIDTADVARLVRAELARRWPAVRFSVKLSRYSGGSSIRVRYDGVETDSRGRALLTLVDYDGNRQHGAPIVSEDEIDYSRGRWGTIPREGMPAARDVSDAVSAYAGRSFDGMIDLAYGLSAWLNPDGSATLARDPGTAGSHGSIPEAIGSRTHPSAIVVRFGASYVFVDAAH